MPPETLAAEARAQSHEASSRTLAELLAAAAEATRAAAAFTFDARIGPLTCRIVSNDPDCGAFLTRCLLPASTAADTPPDLTIFVNAASVPPFAAPPPWNLPHTDQRHLERLHISTDGRVSAFYHLDSRYWMMLDRTTRTGLFWVPGFADIPFWEEASPFKTILHWHLVGRSMAMVHGGVVADARHGVLLVGPGGSGKSTTVAACFQAGLGVCGDDLALVERTGPGWRAHAIYDAVKIIPGSAIPPPPLIAAAPSSLCGSKLLVRYSDAARERFLPSAPLRAIMHCTITGRDATSIAPLGAGAMLRALAPPTVFLLRGHEAETTRRISELVRTLPCHQLALGTDPAGAAAAVRGFLAEIPA